MVAKSANAPVFGLYDTLLGTGIFGGSMLSFEAEGARVGKPALDILNGKLDLAEPVTILAVRKMPMFDCFVKSRKTPFIVIPAKAGIQEF